MAKFIGTAEEIGRYLGDFLDGLVDGRVEELKRSYGNICVACGRRETALETVPAKGYGREQTLRSVLERGKYFCVDGEYLVGLNDLIDDYWDSLEPAEDNFFFLCLNAGGNMKKENFPTKRSFWGASNNAGACWRRPGRGKNFLPAFQKRCCTSGRRKAYRNMCGVSFLRCTARDCLRRNCWEICRTGGTAKKTSA